VAAAAAAVHAQVLFVVGACALRECACVCTGIDTAADSGWAAGCSSSQGSVLGCVLWHAGVWECVCWCCASNLMLGLLAACIG
jgi:hypothetical protein